MKILELEQGSPEWFEARCGLPTASNFSKIITATGKPSTQAKTYMNSLIAESVTGASEPLEKTEWMIRGTEMEEEARDWFAMHQGKEVRQVGMILNDDETMGCSPDGLVSEKIGLEIKCPKASTHVGYLLGKKMPSTYMAQVHGSMYVSGMSKWMFVSYHPGFSPFVIEVKRDGYTDAVGAAMQKFVLSLESAKKKIIGETK